ncbi:MAG TPA: DNA mismatch repair endonuclease MutL [Candidatus Limnocylindria bacterium]|nr:DNA mismatch repair endonuclease MutL [Candidatus Limnocylindria bacterium]
MTAPRIRRLPDHLVNKIAAGEVVERPASVVKELVENALDALCTQVAVDLRDAGRALIRVTDDGVGMSSDEVDLALLRHATSKLATDADLDAITTLGFRGEALPAICAVTRFSVLSCPRGAHTGTLVRGEGGAVNEKLLVAAPAGTTVEAQDLFFNTPARLKFMKSAQSEVAAALRLLEAITLAHQDVHFRVSHNGRPALGAPRARSLRDRIGALWGFERAGKLLEVERKDGPLAISGLVAPPQLARGNRDEIVLIVNGRPVRDTQLGQTLIEAYRPLLARDQFPVAVLRLDLPPQEVDVNVHPTKAWVRFRSPRQVQEVLYRAVQDALRQAHVVQPQRGLSGHALTDDRASGDATGSFSIESGGPDMAPALPQSADTLVPAGQALLFHESPAQFSAVNFGTVIGQLQDTFIVAATDEEIFFLDQHVAHERVLFERLLAELEAGPLASQEQLFPQPVELGAGQAALVQEWAETLEGLGFRLEGWSGSTVVLRAVPALLRGQEPRRLIEALVEDVNRPRKGEPQPLLHRALSFVACHAAIKAHAPLQREEMARLIADLAVTSTPYFCPHGRPIVSRLSLRDIKRELGRTW